MILGFHSDGFQKGFSVNAICIGTQTLSSGCWCIYLLFSEESQTKA